MSKSKRKAVSRAVSIPENAREIDHLVVIRESDRHDRVLMDGMIQQTLALVSHLPGAKMLIEAGLDVLDNPAHYGGNTQVVGTSTITTVEFDGVVYLYSMGTAAKDDLDRANAFVTHLVDLIRKYRPTHLWAANLTRIVRSVNWIGIINQVLSEHTRYVHCETDLDMSTPEGQMMFYFLGIIASAERDYIVRRHLAGRVAQWKRGEWIPNSYPPGYRIENRKLVLDKAQIQPVQKMLRILADHSLTGTQRIEKIGALNIATPKLKAMRGEDITVAGPKARVLFSKR